MEEVKQILKNLLKWSDRIGSDERYEINLAIQLIEELQKK